MSVSCRICLLLCMCVCRNKPDLEFSFLLPVICVAALVVGALVTGAGWMARSEGLPVPELQDNPHLAPCKGNHQGGGYEAESRWRSSIWQLERSSSSPMRVEGLWRQSLSHADSDDRLPASSTPSMILMTKGRSHGAKASTGVGSSSSSRLHAQREAVLRRLGGHLSFFRLTMAGWRSGDPKWCVPGGGRTGSKQAQCFGPDCNRSFRFRVLLAKTRDWFVMFFLLSPLLRFVMSLLFI